MKLVESLGDIWSCKKVVIYRRAKVPDYKTRAVPCVAYPD